jgi:hypothetical protein
MLSGAAGCLVRYDAGGCDGDLDIRCSGIRLVQYLVVIEYMALRRGKRKRIMRGDEARQIWEIEILERKERLTPRNIVATVNLECRLDLKTIALHARNAEYNPKVSPRSLLLSISLSIFSMDMGRSGR